MVERCFCAILWWDFGPQCSALTFQPMLKCRCLPFSFDSRRKNMCTRHQFKLYSNVVYIKRGNLIINKCIIMMIIDILIIMSRDCKSRAGSFASTKKLSAGEVRKAPGHRQRLHIRSSSRSVYNPSVIWLRSDKRAIKMEKGTINWTTVYRPTREFFTHTETSSLPAKGCNVCLPMFGTHGHWAVRVLKRATPTGTMASVYSGHRRGPVTLAPIAERLAVELSLPVFTT